MLDQPERSWSFVNVASEPVPSLLRGFSAPVALDDGLGDAALLTLLAHDTDPFNRWEAGQRLSLRRLLAAVQSDALPALDEAYLQALRSVLRHPTLDPAFKAMVLALPGEGYVAEQLAVVDPQRIHAVREHMLDHLAEQLHADWAWAYEQHQVRGGYAPQRGQAGQRALAGRALAMLCRHAARSGNPVWPGRAYQQVKDAGNMSERLAALNALVHARAELADAALQRFHALAHGNALVIDKWFEVQARASEDPRSSMAAAPRWRVSRRCCSTRTSRCATRTACAALLVSLCRDNPAAFHRADASGYVFWAERLIELDAINPSLAGAPGPRDGPLEPPGRALPQCGARGHRPRRRAQRTQRRRARDHPPCPGERMKRVSLTQYLVEQQREHGRIPGQLRLLIEVVARACKRIAISVNKGPLGDVIGTAHTENVQGEVQKKLDIISNDVLIEANEWGGHLAALASEEMDTIHVVPNRYPQGEYLLLYDPLDGSSNIDVNVSIGTIFRCCARWATTTAWSRTTSCSPGASRRRPATACTARRRSWC